MFLKKIKPERPSNMPTSRGIGFIVCSKAHSDNAADIVTRRSRTGFIAYLNCSPANWF